MQSLSLSDLLQLAQAAHRFGCSSVLQLLDDVLVKQCMATNPPSDACCDDAILDPESVPKLYQLAHNLQLTGFEAQVGHYIGKHADQIELSQLHPLSAHIARGAVEARAELIRSMQALKRKRNA